MKYMLSIALLLTTPAAYAQADPFVGAWSMNVSASRYESALPKAMRIEMASTEEGIHYRSETTQRDNRVVSAEYTADYDGKPAAVIANGKLMAPIALKRIDAMTVEASYIRGLQVVATSRRSLSRNGRVMTITTTTYDERHRATTNVGVYQRMPAESK
jgi:hypothetical protein